MTELAILVGLPGAGKTSFFRARLAATHAHVSKDVIGHGRDTARRQLDLARKALREGRSVAVDNTVGSSRVDLQACKLEYSIVSPK